MKTILKNELNRFLVLVLTLGASGCATSPAPIYYTLSRPAATAADSTSNISAEIGPFELPEYLDRPQMVTAGPGATIKLDEFHRWAEPLGEIFVRTLATNVGRQLGSDAILETASYRGFEAPHRVLGRVQRFEADSDGRAILEVQWTIVDRNNTIAKAGMRARYEAIAEDSKDIDARVHSLGEALDKFAGDVASALRDLPQP